MAAAGPTTTSMYLNAIWTAGQKSWKAYWFEIRESFLYVSTEVGKEPFTAIHLGVLKVKPSKDHPDRPDVLEFYDGEGFTDTKFYVFTYDPFDILDFFKAVAQAHSNWKTGNARDGPGPAAAIDSCQVEVKGSGFFSTATTWNVGSGRIQVARPPKTILMSDIQLLTPQTQPQHPWYFRMKCGQEGIVEHRMQSGLKGLTDLLTVVYNAKFAAKGPLPVAAPPIARDAGGAAGGGAAPVATGPPAGAGEGAAPVAAGPPAGAAEAEG